MGRALARTSTDGPELVRLLTYLAPIYPGFVLERLKRAPAGTQLPGPVMATLLATGTTRSARLEVVTALGTHGVAPGPAPELPPAMRRRRPAP